MARPGNYPLVIVIGDTSTIEVTNQDENGAAIDITGRSYAAQVRETADASSVLATYSCAITNAAAGVVTCTLPASTTAALSPGTGVFDLEETNNATVKTTIVGGPVQIVQDVTR